uniref:Uncharacterized protein n=1 Tax=Ixodes ricinus TaxID=34613 RepID=A0A147BFD0_IXORI
MLHPFRLLLLLLTRSLPFGGLGLLVLFRALLLRAGTVLRSTLVIPLAPLSLPLAGPLVLLLLAFELLQVGEMPTLTLVTTAPTATAPTSSPGRHFQSYLGALKRLKW